MLKRIITAVIALAIFIPVCIFSDTIVFPLAMALGSFVAVCEMTRCVGVGKKMYIVIPSCIIGVVMPFIPYVTEQYTIHLEFVCCIVYLIVILAATVFSRGKVDFMNASSAFLGVFYIAVSFTCIVLLREVGKYVYLLVFIGPWVSDTFAYVCGSLIGRHKLMPEISPKKTVEGSLGGIVFGSISFVVFGLIIKTFFAPDMTANLWFMALTGLVVSVISQIGDISASVIKRRFNIKDYGRVLPGHGGIMDRFDSVLLTAPVLYIVTQLPFFSDMIIH